MVEVTTRPLTLRDALKSGLNNKPGLRVVGGETPVAGLRLIARSPAEADRGRAASGLSALVRSASQQYWVLVAAGTKVLASEAPVELGENALHRERAKLDMGIGRLADIAAAEEQLDRFKLQYVSDTADVIPRERQLRSTLGMPPADNRRIAPTSVPFDGPLAPDLSQGLAAMMEHRPEILTARKDAPDFVSEISLQTTREVQQFHTKLNSNYEQLTAARVMKAATMQRMEAAKAFAKEGKFGVEDYLDTVNRWATAVAREADGLAVYNANIVAYEESKGTLLDHAQIRLQWEPTPADARIFEPSPTVGPRVDAPGRTYSFRFSVGSGPRPTEVRGSFTVGPPAP